MFAELLAPLRSLAEYVDMMPSSIAFRESIYVSPYTTVAHVIAMCFFAGLILAMDLRLMGWGFMKTPFSHLQKRLFPLRSEERRVGKECRSRWSRYHSQNNGRG